MGEILHAACDWYWFVLVEENDMVFIVNVTNITGRAYNVVMMDGTCDYVGRYTT